MNNVYVTYRYNAITLLCYVIETDKRGRNDKCFRESIVQNLYLYLGNWVKEML